MKFVVSHEDVLSRDILQNQENASESFFYFGGGELLGQGLFSEQTIDVIGYDFRTF